MPKGANQSLPLIALVSSPADFDTSFISKIRCVKWDTHKAHLLPLSTLSLLLLPLLCVLLFCAWEIMPSRLLTLLLLLLFDLPTVCVSVRFVTPLFLLLYLLLLSLIFGPFFFILPLRLLSPSSSLEWARRAKKWIPVTIFYLFSFSSFSSSFVVSFRLSSIFFSSLNKSPKGSIMIARASGSSHLLFEMSHTFKHKSFLLFFVSHGCFPLPH